MYLFPEHLILLKGGGDLGTGAAWRLHKAGFPVIITELAEPLVVRRTVALASAVFDGEIAVEGITAWRADSLMQARSLLDDEMIPVLVDPECRVRHELKPRVLIDAVLAKRNTGTRRDDAPFVLALGPGFTPNVDCHAVIETQRGHNLGRVLWSTPAEPNTGVPGEIGGKSAERVLRAPIPGTLKAQKQIGDMVTRGETIAWIESDDGKATEPVRAPFDGILRGLVHPGLRVRAGLKIGDVDPRAQREHCFTISDKALAIGGGALEAVLEWMKIHQAAPPRDRVARSPGEVSSL